MVHLVCGPVVSANAARDLTSALHALLRIRKAGVKRPASVSHHFGVTSLHNPFRSGVCARSSVFPTQAPGARTVLRVVRKLLFVRISNMYIWIGLKVEQHRSTVDRNYFRLRRAVSGGATVECAKSFPRHRLFSR